MKSRKPTRRDKLLAFASAFADSPAWVWLLFVALLMGLAFWAGTDFRWLS